MRTGFSWVWSLGMAMLLGATTATVLHAEAVKTQIRQVDGKWELVRDGKPYLIKGGGGGGDKKLLAEVGGNSFRTWGVGNETQGDLDEAQKYGLTVTVGYWLGHKEHGFDYTNAAALEKQKEDVRRAVLKYKDHPAVLAWALGNEMENGADSKALWTHMEDLAKMVKEIDPNHPVMTVVAEIGGDKVQQIHKYCPDLDMVGINSYGGGPSIAERYVKNGGTKPIVITEFGPPGTWEIGMNAFKAAPELTSTQKAERYRATYEKSVLGAPGLCVGSYAFTWGFKVEATATWYGMFLPDGSKLASVDTMQELWSGKKPEFPVPAMTKLALTSPDQVKPGDTVTAAVEVTDPSGRPLKIDWRLYNEQSTYNVQGTGGSAGATFADAIAENGGKTVSVKMPASGGVYRIYCYAHNDKNGAAVGSLPVKVSGAEAPYKAAKAKLPLVIYGADSKNPAYIASGWMGNTKAISMQADCTDNLRTGAKTCLKVSYSAKNNWAGAVWQSPPNDWGDKAGGFDFTDAKQLTFWARGDKGGEKVKFGFGMIGKDKKFSDSGKKDTGNLVLTTEWKQYSIDLKGLDMSCIKSGFYWTLQGQGDPVVFYLDDIRFE